MRFGLALPQYDVSVAGEDPLRFDTIVEYAQLAERLGFDSIHLSDHLRWDIAKYGGSADESGVYEPLTTLGALSRVTERVRLGTLVLCEALRPPAVLAKSLVTLDRLSGGRLDIGIGAGWYEPDYAAIGMALPRPGVRLARLGEYLEILVPLLAGETVTFDGDYHSVHGARLLPPPVQSPPPVFVGGRGDRMLQTIADLGVGWNTCWALTHDAYAERLAVLGAACERAGREVATIPRSLGLYTLVGESDRDLDRRFERLRGLTPSGVLDGQTAAGWRAGRLVGTVQEVRESVDHWESLGVTEIVCGFGAVPFQVGAADDIEAFAEALIRPASRPLR